MLTTYDANVITLVKPANTVNACRLLAGRAWMIPGAAPGENDQPVDLDNVAARLRALRDAAAGQFVGRGEMACAVATALAAGEHVFVYSPPGTAKSSLMRLFAEGIAGKFWRIILNPDTSREDVVGPPDPAALKQGQWKRRWAGLATCDIAFLDEVWKASAQVSYMFLGALEERQVAAGEDERAIPLLSAMAASNEVPSDKELQAAYDRFLIRLSIGYLRDPDDFRALMTASAGSSVIAPSITPDEIRLLAATAEAITFNPPSDMLDMMAELWRQTCPEQGRRIGQNGRAISDRRWRKTLKAACAAALLAGETPAPRHLGVARWTAAAPPSCGWAEPDEESDIRNLVLGLTDPVASDVLDAEALLADLKNAAAGLAGMKLQERAEIAGKARKLMGKCDKLLADPAARPYQSRLNTVKTEANEIVTTVLDLMTS